MLPRIAFFVCLVAIPSLPAAGGTISGRVELIEKGGAAAKDLSEAVVYVDGAPAPVKPARTTIVMKRKAFEPHVVAIPVGSTIDFPNQDPIFHNVFSVSAPSRFDLQLYKRPGTASRTFDNPGVVKVYCNIHPQMNAVIVIRDNPWFAVASRDGSFRIEGVPAGHYRLTAWHERAPEASVELDVPAQGTAEAKLKLDASAYKRERHKNKFGKPYSSSDDY